MSEIEGSSSFGKAPRDLRLAMFATLVLIALALCAGNLHLQLGGGAFWPALTGSRDGNLQQILVHESVLPRIAMTWICGAALALSGAVAQQVLRNPLAEPMTLGIFPGAYLALAAAAIWAPPLLTGQRELVALAGGGGAMLIVFALAWRQRMAPIAVILAGMVVSLYCGSLSLAMAISHFQLMTGLMIWGGGALDQQGWDASIGLMWRLAFGCIAIGLLRRPLSLFDAGDVAARGLGLSLTRTRFAALAISVALTACVVAAVGVIGFIGLAAPTLARLAGARRLEQRLLWAPLFGAALLWLTDEVVQTISIRGIFGSQLIPTGAVTSLFGAPMLLWLLRRLKSRPDLRAADASAGGASRRAHPWRLITMLIFATAIVVLVSIAFGRGLHGWHLASTAQIRTLAFWRFPHAAAALAAGIMLGLAGTLIQRMTGNPIASPDLIGVSSGGALGMIAALFIVAAPSAVSLFVSCLIGTAVTLMLQLWFGRRASYAPERMLLIGVAIGALFQAVTGTITSSGDPRAALLLNFVVGSTYYVGTAAAVIASVIAVFGLCLVPLTIRWLETLSLGEGIAGSLGVRVDVARLAVLSLAAVLSAACTLLVGPLSLVGLMAPHLARSIGFARVREQLFAAAAIGALLMTFADWLGRELLFPNEMPAGLMAALVGGPYLVWSMSRKPRCM